MPTRLRPTELPAVCHRRFEPSRIQEQLWSAAYEQLVPQGRRSRPGPDSAGPRRTPQAAEVPFVSDSREEQCA
jgi:hypothetical protein